MGFQGRGNGNAMGAVDEMASLNDEFAKCFSEVVEIIHGLQLKIRALHEELDSIQEDNDLLLDDNKRLREALARSFRA